MIGDFFRGLFGVIWDAIVWIGEFIGSLFQGLINIIIGFFELIFALVDGLLYFLYMIGVLAVKIFSLFFSVAQLVWSFVVGFGKTLASLVYTPRESSNTAYSDMLGRIFDELAIFQLDTLAYICLFIIWFATAVMAIRIFSTIKNQ